MNKKIILLSTTAAIISFVTVIVSLLVFDYFSSFKKEVENNDSGKEKFELVNDSLLIKLDSLLKQKEFYHELLEQEIAEGVARFGTRERYLEKVIKDIDIEIEGIVYTNATEKDIIPEETYENIKFTEPIQDVALKQNTTNATIIDSSIQIKDTTEIQTIETPQTTPIKDTAEMKINKDTMVIKQETENQNDTQ